MRLGWLGLTVLAGLAGCGGGSAGTAVPVCNGTLPLPFDAEVFDFGDRFGETDGDAVLNVIAVDDTLAKPSVEDLEAALAADYVVVGQRESGSRGVDFSLGVATLDGCEFTVMVITDEFALSRRGFERAWYLAVVQRGPSATA